MSVYKPHTTHNSLIRSDEGLTLETSAFESLYSGLFTLSTQLIKPNYLVILPTDAAPQFLAVRVRTDEANFGPPPIGLIFSVKVNHYIQCINITFIWINSIFSIFARRFSRWPQNRQIWLVRLWNLARSVRGCQTTVFYSSKLIVLHAKVSPFFSILKV